MVDLEHGIAMKTLTLVRHAKASNDDPTWADRDRPLADRGRQEAIEMGKRLAGRKVKPDLLLSSPALRALTTAQLMADALGCERKEIVVDDRLYASSAQGLLAVIRALDDTLDRAMLFGHNPEFTELAHRLSSEIVNMPTCAVAEFRFNPTKWSDLGMAAPVDATLDHPAK